MLVNNGQIDKSGPAKEAIKKIAYRFLELVPRLNGEEFNELAKIFDFADIKDEFIQRSGRQDTYLDGNTAMQAINELNAVFIEGNQKSAEMSNQLNNISNELNCGKYDASAIYSFIIAAIQSGAIPSTIQHDNTKQHINKVIKMALAYKNGGTQYGASGANWGNSNNNNNNGWGSSGGTSGWGNSSGWSSSSSNGWGSTTNSNNDWVSGPSSTQGWGTSATNNNSAWTSATSGWGNNSNVSSNNNTWITGGDVWNQNSSNNSNGWGGNASAPWNNNNVMNNNNSIWGNNNNSGDIWNQNSNNNNGANPFYMN